MATTSIWRVNGWLGKVLIYIENPDKTENPDFFEKQDMDGKEAQGLSDVIEYAVQQQKTGKTVESEGETVMRQFVSGVNCSPSTARDEMIAVKKRFGKEDGTVAYHGYQSFAPGEATPELAHEIGLALAKKLWGEKYQVLVATHLDRENHLHNHFVVNTVSFVDGIKYHRTEQDYFDMQRESDRLCREYGLSVIENPQRGKSKHYGEWRAEQEACLLSRHRIDTLEQLNAYRSDVKSQFAGLTEQRKSLYRKLRTKAVLADPARQEYIRAEISKLSAQIKELRREVKLCGDIALRSTSIKDKIQAAREEVSGRDEKARQEPEQGRAAPPGRR